MKKHRLSILMTEDLNKKLDIMSEDLGMSKNQLSLLAIHGLIANYEDKNKTIFAELIKKEK